MLEERLELASLPVHNNPEVAGALNSSQADDSWFCSYWSQLVFLLGAAKTHEQTSLAEEFLNEEVEQTVFQKTAK